MRRLRNTGELLVFNGFILFRIGLTLPVFKKNCAMLSFVKLGQKIVILSGAIDCVDRFYFNRHSAGNLHLLHWSILF